MHLLNLIRAYFSPGERGIFETFCVRREHALENDGETCGGAAV